MLCPAVKVQVTVQPLMGYGELLVTVTVAPKSGGLSDGVCQAIVYATPHEAPVSAGARVLFTATAVTVAAISMAATPRLPRRRKEMAISAPRVRTTSPTGATYCPSWTSRAWRSASRPEIAPSVTSGLAGHHDRAAPQRPGGHFR